METLLPQLLSYPPHPPPQNPLSDTETHRRIKAVVETLHSVPASSLIGGVKGGGDLLDMLDPSINSLPYLYTLLAHINHTSGKQRKASASDSFVPGGSLWLKMIEFMQKFDPIQIRYGGNEFRRLIDLTVLAAARAGSPELAALPVQSAILRIDPSGSTLTSSHLVLVTLCLETRNFASALPVLDKDIFFLPASTERQAEASKSPLSPYPCSTHETSATYITPASGISTKIQSQDYLQYFLYGAMVYMGLKQWERAHVLLDIVINSPTSNNASKIQVEAFKKLILVSLLEKGRFTSAPRTTNSQASKLYDSLAGPYIALAKFFRYGIADEEGVQKLNAEAYAGRSIWQEDSNEGLVNQVISAYRQFTVRHLEKTYAALTIAEIARHTAPDPNDVEATGRYISQLIDDNLLNATISRPSNDPKTWVVRFLGPTSKEGYSNTEEQRQMELEHKATNVKTLVTFVKEAARQAETSRDFVQEVKRMKKLKVDGITSDESSPFPLGNAFDQDEDMMADL